MLHVNVCQSSSCNGYVPPAFEFMLIACNGAISFRGSSLERPLIAFCNGLSRGGTQVQTIRPRAASMHDDLPGWLRGISLLQNRICFAQPTGGRDHGEMDKLGRVGRVYKCRRVGGRTGTS